jgi:hypothetical protein
MAILENNYEPERGLVGEKSLRTPVDERYRDSAVYITHAAEA